jgi:D-aminoacyl-tRNA deacylase
LVIVNTWVLGDLSKGNCPSFISAIHPAPAKAVVEAFYQHCAQKVTVAQGRFGADMRVESVEWLEFFIDKKRTKKAG